MTSRTIERAVTDLPEPDSPTRPRVSPRSRWNETSSTAGASRPSRRRKTVVRPETTSAAFSDELITVFAEDVTQNGAHLAYGGTSFDRGNHGRHQVGVSPGRFGQIVKRDRMLRGI